MEGQGEADQPAREFEPTKSMELVSDIKRGDEGAMNALLDRYLGRLLRVVRIKMGKRLRSLVDPEDIVQETYIVAMKKLPELEVRTPASIMQYLGKIADFQIRNKMDYARAQKRDQARERRLKSEDSVDQSAASGVVVPAPGPSPSQHLARAELEEAIDSYLEAMEPPDYREVILMRDYYGADWDTIRRDLGRPTVDAVQELYHRAHKKLREKMRRFLS